jgi:hypothetical protein
MPDGTRPAPLPGDDAPEGDNAALCHLVAISMDRWGRPVRLFTTNRWVTAETWYGAADVIACVERFDMDVAHPSWPLNRWITALVSLYRRPIRDLVRKRDRVVDEWRSNNPDVDVFEDRALEVTSSLDIDLERTLAEVRRVSGLE